MKVESPATGVAGDVGAETAVETAPALAGVDVAQGSPDAASDPAFGPMRRYLELDLERVERVHAEHGRRARADTGERVVLCMPTQVGCE